MLSDVQKFFANKTIFITGVTGFLGHVLLSKLLCSCPDIRCIYILMREKKEKDVYYRFKELFDNPIFKTAKELNPDYEIKVKPIKGDCSLSNLGISESDRQIIQDEAEIVFHAAATVKFDAPLRDAVYTNIRSTDNLLDMAHSMTNLKAFVHVSTAFSPCSQRKVIEERFYEPPIKANNLLTLIEQLDDKILDEITPILLKQHPNTYVYTKLIAESLCRAKGSHLPITIFRPSIVIPTEKEPVPGWVNNIYGPIGIITGYGMGILKVMRLDTQCQANIVPCDYVINALIASAYSTANFRPNDINKEMLIFNYDSSITKFSITWGTFVQQGKKAYEKHPFSECIYLPWMITNKHEVIYRILVLLLHLLPAFVIDLGLTLRHRNPRFLQLYHKIHKLTDLLTFFCTQEWTITNDNVNKLWDRLSEKDRKIFYFNLDHLLDTEKYFEIIMSGVRSYVLKDDQLSLPEAFKRRKRLLVLHYSIISIFVALLLYWSNTILF